MTNDNRHNGCIYRHCCTKQDKWCPYLQKRQHKNTIYSKGENKQ